MASCPCLRPTTCRRRAIPHCSDDGAASILKFGLEIKNRCTKEAVNRETHLASILKSGLEIKNHFSSKSVLQAEPFFSAATKTGYVSNFKELLFYGVRAAV